MSKIKKEKHLNPSELFNPSEKQKEKRRTILQIVFTAVLAVAGVYAVFALLMKATHREPGYYKLEAAKSESAPIYASAYSFEHYFEGESLEIKTAVDECSNKYSGILERIYKLTDAVNLYQDVKNIAYLNAHIGEAVELEKELFDILASAAERSGDSGSCSLFSGVLNSAWNDIIYSNAQDEFDPLVNADQKMRIETLASLSSDAADVRLEIIDAQKHIVKLSVSENYLKAIRELDAGETVLDLCLLRDAYVIDAVCALMENEGYNNGYMMSESGVVKALSGMTSAEHKYVSYGLLNGEPVQAYTMPMLPGSACCNLRSFGLDGEAGYYTLRSESGETFRHPNFCPVSGDMDDTFLSVCAFTEKGSAVDAAAAASDFIWSRGASLNLTDENQSGSAAVCASDGISYIRKDDSLTVYAAKAQNETLKLIESIGYTVKYY